MNGGNDAHLSLTGVSCIIVLNVKFKFSKPVSGKNRGGFVFVPYNECSNLLGQQDQKHYLASQELYTINLALVATSMKSHEAFDQTVSHFKLKNVWLHEHSGVSESSISRFRRGKQNLSTDDLDNLLAAMDDEQRQFYYSLLLGSISEKAIANLLSAIAVQLRSGSAASPYEDEKIPA